MLHPRPQPLGLVARVTQLVIVDARQAAIADHELAADQHVADCAGRTPNIQWPARIGVELAWAAS